jgi:hypothetical protein
VNQTATEAVAGSQGRRAGQRVLVYGLLAAILGMAWFEATLWPLNSWQLFSYTRGPTSSAIEVTARGPEGERSVAVSTLWREYRVLDHALGLTSGAAALDELCRDLLDRVAERRPAVTGLVVERVVSHRPDGPATAAVERSRTTVVRCDR